MESTFQVCANRVDVLTGEIFPVRLSVVDGRVARIESIETASGYLIPGFVDAHIHIESSMLVPAEFARVAVMHGTVATVSDPHEIANVCGLDGIELMLQSAAQTPFKFCFGAPSCVPATQFETAGAAIELKEIEQLLDDPRIHYLSEVMNFPGVISGDPSVVAKLSAARARGMPIDGHAPGLRGEQVTRYFSAGISTDHECVSQAEALEKIHAGCLIAIREGSAAKNFEALCPLLESHPDSCMFCSDDKHPDELLVGHINQLAVRAIGKGYDVMDVLRAATLNPARHYGLDVGLLQLDDPADFILVDDLQTLQIRKVWIDGALVADEGRSLLQSPSCSPLNNFAADSIQVETLRVAIDTQIPASQIPNTRPLNKCRARTIDVMDGQLLTRSAEAILQSDDVQVYADPSQDVLKLVVVNRYRNAQPAVAFVRGFELRQGAIASSVAHDSHNIVAVGASDADIAAAVNAIIDTRGGLSLADGEVVDVLPLPVGGLMSLDRCEVVAEAYLRLDRHVKRLGCRLTSPFMTLSFLALPVIPSLKLTDQGLFDVDSFCFVPVVLNADASTC